MQGNLCTAKVSPPRVFGATLRERLFRRLDGLAERPCVWVTSPAGAGKSTLAATYLEARGVPALWMRIDAADDDLPTFFFSLAEGARTWIGPQTGLPLLTAEFASDVHGFARRFFRQLFALLTEHTVLVFDDVHQAPAASAILREALEELPSHLAIWALSRSGPPAQMARAVAYGQVFTLERDELRLTNAEALEIAAVRGFSDEQAVASINARCEGWTAGLVIGLSGRHDECLVPVPGDRELLDDYFATEIFEPLPAATRDVFLATAFLPTFSAEDAALLTQRANAGDILELQYQRQCFISRPRGGSLYRFHDLFRAFLLSRVVTAGESARVARLRERSAELLHGRGEFEEALELFAAAGCFDAAADVIVSQASQLVASGRHRTLARWLQLLPSNRVQTDAWLTYWLATSLVPFQTVEAHEQFARAHRLFRDSGERSGELLAATGAIEAILAHANSNLPLDAWIPILEPHLSDAALKSPDQTRAWYAFLQAALHRRPGHPKVPQGIAWLRSYLKEGSIPPGEALYASAVLLFYACIAADHAVAAEIVAGYSDTVEREDLPPVARWTWYYWHGIYRLWRLEYEYAKQCWERCSGIAAQCGLSKLDFLVHGCVVMVDLAEDRLDVAEWRLQQMDEARQNGHKVADTLYWMAQMFLRLYRRRGNVGEAMNRMIASVRLAGLFNLELLCLGDAAAVHLIQGNEAAARILFSEARTRREATVVRMVDAQLVALEAVLQYRGGEVSKAHDTFARALDLVAETGTCGCMLWVRAGLSTLFGEAVRFDRHAHVIRDLVRRYQIPAPSRATERWPWPIRIRAYGGLRIEVNDAPLPAGRKAQQKVLELLKLLIAEGGSEVDGAILADWLWPDVDGDAGQNNLRATLKRLRDMLGHAESLRVHDGKVSLNDRICWLDTWALREWIQSMLEKPGGVPEETGMAQLQALYRGPSLRGEDAPWLNPARRRDRQYLRHLLDEVSRSNQHVAARLKSYVSTVDPELVRV